MLILCWIPLFSCIVHYYYVIQFYFIFHLTIFLDFLIKFIISYIIMPFYTIVYDIFSNTNCNSMILCIFCYCICAWFLRTWVFNDLNINRYQFIYDHLIFSCSSHFFPPWQFASFTWIYNKLASLLRKLRNRFFLSIIPYLDGIETLFLVYSWFMKQTGNFALVKLLLH